MMEIGTELWNTCSGKDKEHQQAITSSSELMVHFLKQEAP